MLLKSLGNSPSGSFKRFADPETTPIRVFLTGYNIGNNRKVLADHERLTGEGLVKHLMDLKFSI